MKSYREQGLRCDSKGIRFSEHCIACGQEILMCRKYGGGCISSKCLWSRLNLWERLTWKQVRKESENNMKELKKTIEENNQCQCQKGKSAKKSKQKRKRKVSLTN